jgi:hypothetical protein
MKKILLLIVSILTINLYGLLPPFYQSLDEIKAIINSDELIENANSAFPILEIKKVQKGYLIITSDYLQLVEINNKDQDKTGPAKFDLFFDEKRYF